MGKLGLAGSASLLAISSFTAQAQVAYGINYQNQLVSFNLASPQSLHSARFIQGLAPNEELISIDFRTSTNQLYGIGSFNHLYQIDLSTAQANRIGGAFAPQLNGVEFDMDFDPVADRIALVSNLGQSMFVDPSTGTATPNVSLGSGGNVNLFGIAYSNNYVGASSSTLYGLGTSAPLVGVQYQVDLSSGSLTLLGNSGTGGDTLVGGFDIAANGPGYAVVTFMQTSGLANTSRLVRFTPGKTNSAVVLGPIGAVGAVTEAQRVRDLAIPIDIPAPATVVLLALAALPRRRRA